MFDWHTALLTSAFWMTLLGLLVYFIKNPEKVEKWQSLIAGWFSFLSLKIEKSSVAKGIQSEINSFAKDVSSKAKESVIPYGVKVKWISDTTREAFVSQGKVIVKMQHHKNQAKNLLYAVLDWVNRGLVPESRHLINKDVLRSLDFAFINKFFTEKKRFDSKQLFLDEIYEPEATKGSLIERYTSIFNKLDRKGLFTGVVLQEFASLGRRVGSAIPNKEIRSETIGFTNMLEKLSRKSRGKDISPNYKGLHIRCSIVLIAKPEKYFMYGLSPYLNYINKCCTEGMKTFYICAIGDQNISIVRRIRDSYQESKKISVVSEHIESIDGAKAMILFLETTEDKSNA